MSQGELQLPKAKYIVDRSFRHNINGASIQFDAGRMVEDEATVSLLLATNSPISKIKNEDDLLVCPHCGKSSSLAAQQGARALLRRSKRIAAGHV